MIAGTYLNVLAQGVPDSLNLKTTPRAMTVVAHNLAVFSVFGHSPGGGSLFRVSVTCGHVQVHESWRSLIFRFLINVMHCWLCEVQLARNVCPMVVTDVNPEVSKDESEDKNLCRYIAWHFNL